CFPLCPRTRTLLDPVSMSQTCHEQTHAGQQTASLFDHLGGASKQRRRHCEAERLRGREIDEEVDIGRLYDRQVSRFFALEDPAYMVTGLPKRFRLIGAVAHQ